MYQHRKPDGERCSALGNVGHTCLHCGTKIGEEVPVGFFDGEAKPARDEPSGDGEFDEISTERLIEVLKGRGAEVGSISIGGISGIMLILRDRRKVEPG